VSTGQEFPSIAIDSNDDIHVVWQGKGWGAWPNYRQIIYRKKTVFGWEPEEVLTDTHVSATYGERYPAIALDKWDNIHVVWGGTVGPGNYSNIRYRRKTIGGWNPQEDVTTDADCYHWCPRIAIDSEDNAHVVWFGMLSSEGWVAYNPHYRMRTLGWWPIEKLCTIDQDQNYYLTVSVDRNDAVHVEWTGQGWGSNVWNYNLQYRQKPDGTDPLGSWQAQVALTDDANDYWGGSALWAMWPLIAGSRTNILDGGYYITYEKLGDSVEFYTPATAPTVSTSPATDITHQSARLNGVLSNDGGEPCDCCFEWGETTAYGNTTPTVSQTSGQTFSQVIVALNPKKTYHFRAKATNSVGTAYGSDQAFTTLAAIPKVITERAANVSYDLATLIGRLEDDGGEPCEVRFQWGRTAACGVDTPWQPGKRTGDFFGDLVTGLRPDTTYHFRAQGRNSAGVGSGLDAAFRTLSIEEAIEKGIPVPSEAEALFPVLDPALLSLLEEELV
jgi:hypothetical protein